MKKKFIISLCITLVISCLSVVIIPKNQVVSAQEAKTVSFDESKVLETRFLNMLNHNFVYNDAFFTVEDIVNCSMPALLELRDTEDDSFIAQNYVSDYVYDMYGIEDIDYAVINTQFEQKTDFVYIIPRGFTVFKHTILSVTENEDGSFTVKTKVIADAHDSEEITDICTSLIVPNENSRFGYNIISSVIDFEEFSI
ncbi:MAG: hypothetical protein IKT93_01930 [Clostridia bacterium]|nr:hypothetical protein [Clostridia bacterium]